MKSNTLLSSGFSLSQPVCPLIFAIAALGTASNALSATATSTATSHVVGAIAITAPVALDFGKFVPALGAGTVTISHSGARTATGVTLVNVGTFYSAAKFSVTGGANANYSIEHDGDAALTAVAPSAGTPMALTKTSSFTNSDVTAGTVNTGVLGVDGTQDIYIGGTIVVGAAQAPGVYAGNISVSVEYN